LAASPLEIIGREHERAEIGRIISAACLGLSGVLVLRGEAGIGKTALLDHAAASARGLQVHRIVGVDSEMELGYAALQQLLRPLVELIDELPAPQGRALRSAVGIGEGTRPDRFVVGLATLSVLSAAAAQSERGLLIVIDDGQWIDRESASAIAFVARRLHADRSAMLIAVRPGAVDALFDDIPTCTLEPLTRHEAQALLATAVQLPIDDLTRRRILDDALGNPLAIVEFAAAPAQDWGAESPISAPLPLNARLVARYADQLNALRPATQRLLLTAAADPTGDPALLWRVGRERGFDEEAIEEAEAAGLVSVAPSLTFRHPLIRESIYHAASDLERRQTHEALANAMDGVRDPGRRAWHRAAATLPFDDDVARELEAAAERTDVQGGFAASAALLVRAADFATDSRRRTTLRLRAAEADLMAGRLSRAEADLAPLASIQDPFLRAQLRRLQGVVAFYLCSKEASASIMLEAADALQHFDARAARDTVLEALKVATWMGCWGGVSPRDVAEVGRSLLRPPGEPDEIDLLCDAIFSLYIDGPRRAASSLRRALELAISDPVLSADPRRLTLACYAAFAIGDVVAARAFAAEFVEAARREGMVSHLPEALQYAGVCELMVGSLADADALFADVTEKQVARGTSGWGDVDRMLVAAWRGDEAETRALAARVLRRADESRVGFAAGRVQVALALLELGRGNYAAATAGTYDGWSDDLALASYIACDAVEARARVGERESARSTVEWLTQRALANRSALDLGLLARAQALLADDAEAEVEYARSIDLLEEARATRQRARTQLVYGEWLHVRGRRKEARTQLRAAYETFEAEGAVGFAERARMELLTTGETARRAVGADVSALTQQETQIARLAASGATNPEIAAELYISPSTVEYHLHKVFRKLDIASRRELPNALHD
jgi:DNA-binding CsgD family transcriptional regulator